MPHLLICALIILGLTACHKANEPPIPAYIFVPNVGMSTRAEQGTASHNIKDAWISVNGYQIGVNNLPTLLPYILPEGDSALMPLRVRVSAGIEMNGLSDVRLIYPFYTRHEEDRILRPGQIDTIYPSFGYLPEAKVTIIEDFEGPGVVFGEDLDGDSATYLIKTTEDVFEGNASGKVILPELQFAAATSFRLSNLQPQGTAFPVYLELNYRCNIPVEVGLIAHYPNGSRETLFFSGMNPRPAWNKIYFDLTGQIFRFTAPQYSIALRALKRPNDPPVEIYLDNIKILYF